MRIFLTGSSGTGKSTLAKHVSIKYGLPLLPSASRAAAKELGITDWSKLFGDVYLADEFQARVWSQQRSLEAEHAKTGFVSDRTFDSIAYNVQHGRNASKQFLSADWIDYTDGLQKFDALVFFIRPCPEVVAVARDGTRDDFLTPEMIYRIDGVIQFVLETHAIPYFPIPFPSMRDRIRLVEGVIDLALQIPTPREVKNFTPPHAPDAACVSVKTSDKWEPLVSLPPVQKCDVCKRHEPTTKQEIYVNGNRVGAWENVCHSCAAPPLKTCNRCNEPSPTVAERTLTNALGSWQQDLCDRCVSGCAAG